jgi:hypothetical protein
LNTKLWEILNLVTLNGDFAYCEVEGTGIEVLAILSKVLLWNFPERAKANHEKILPC